MNAMPAGPGDAGTLAVFVYFRARPSDAAATEAALRRQLALVRERLGLSGRYGERHEHDRPHLTWLECYEGLRASGLAAALEALERASTDSGLAAFALDGRHIEVFAMR